MALARRTLSSDTATSNGATSISISPTGMEENDWLLFGVISAGGGDTHSNTAGDLVRVHNDLNTGSTITTSTWKKKCGASEAGPYTISTGTTRRWAIIAVCYSGGDSTDIVEEAPTQTTASGASSLAVTGVDPAATGGVHLIFEFSRIAAGSTQTFTAPTDYTELTYDGGVSEPQSTHGTNANAAAACSVRALPDASATGNKTFSVSVSDRLNGGSILLLPAGGTTVNGGLSTETDTALTGSARKTAAGDLATTTDTALTGTAAKQAAGGLAASTETALAGTARKTAAGGLASSTETALPGAVVKTVSGGLATSTETALAGAATKTAAGGLATETDSGLAGAASKTVAGGLAAEADSGLAGSARKTATGGLASETDTALMGSVGGTTVVSGGLAVETDAAIGGTARKVATGGLATQTAAALAASAHKRALAGLATETDTALPRAVTARATSTPAVTAGRTSVPSVTAGRTSAAAVTTPATSTPTVGG